MIRSSSLAFALVGIAAVACGSGGPDSTGTTGGSSSGGSSTSSSSSSTSSSGQTSSSGANCDAICIDSASLGFDESNTGGRLDGAVVETCLRDRCASGTLTKGAGGTYTLGLQAAADGGSLQVYANVTAIATETLRFRITWTLDRTGAYAPADGDTYTVNAHAGSGGAELFARTFTATYQTATECGTVCKQYSGTQ